jgi:hypothetical protein
MRKTIEGMVPTQLRPETDSPVFKVGRIVEIQPAGKPVVDYDGNEFGPLEARCIRRDPFSREYSAGCEVLLAFEDQDSSRPIVLGAVSETCQTQNHTTPFRAAGAPASAIVDGNRVVLRGSMEIILECGQSSLVLQKDGKIVLKGVEIVSRASRTNKIRGACVKIN